MKRGLYANRPNLTIGFHGCDQSVVEKVVEGKENLLASTNDYDWLGNGVYFWENNEERALEWAIEMSKRKNSRIKNPAVIGAIIDLGYQMTHKFNQEANKRAYDSVRGVFWEGKPLYPNAGFAEKNHIQICVCNPNCIKGYFLPRGINVDYPDP